MAVYTKLSENQLKEFFSKYSVGKILNYKEIKEGKARIVSFFAKKARGMMARYIIQNQINDPDVIRKFDLGGYEYNDSLSNTMEPVFTRVQA